MLLLCHLVSLQPIYAGDNKMDEGADPDRHGILMANQYFSYLPDFDYVSRLSGSQISDYVRVKNLFKRTKVNDTIFGNLTNFTKYKIIGNERPDQVAFKIYGESNLDWLVMLTNNIVNYQNEWPLPNDAFYDYLLAKYGTEEKMFSVHHYETQEVKSSDGVTIVPQGSRSSFKLIL